VNCLIIYLVLYSHKNLIRNIQNGTGKLARASLKNVNSQPATSQNSLAAFLLTRTRILQWHQQNRFVSTLQIWSFPTKPSRLHSQHPANSPNLYISIIVMQQNSAHFEEGILRSVQSASRCTTNGNPTYTANQTYTSSQCTSLPRPKTTSGSLRSTSRPPPRPRHTPWWLRMHRFPNYGGSGSAWQL
jgi:hypothetical protein